MVKRTLRCTVGIPRWEFAESYGGHRPAADRGEDEGLNLPERSTILPMPPFIQTVVDQVDWKRQSVSWTWDDHLFVNRPSSSRPNTTEGVWSWLTRISGL